MFDSGILRICRFESKNEDGGMPVEGILPVSTAFYGERSVTYSRIYQAKGADCTIDMVVRVPEETEAEPGMYAIIGDDPDESKNTQYRIDLVDSVIVKRSTRAKELTLVKSEVLYDVNVDK